MKYNHREKKNQNYGLRFKDAVKVCLFACVIGICTCALLYYTDMWIKIVAATASSFILSKIILSNRFKNDAKVFDADTRPEGDDS